jgi:hypothetical protein
MESEPTRRDTSLGTAGFEARSAGLGLFCFGVTTETGTGNSMPRLGSAGLRMDRAAATLGRRETRPPRTSPKAERPQTGPVAALPGEGLLELEGRLGCRCERVKDRGLVKRRFPGGRTARG